MKKLAILILLSLSVASCSMFDYMTQANPVLVDIAVRQAVYRYIDAAESEEGKIKRAGDVVYRLKRVDAYIEGSPSSDADNIMKAINDNIEWEKLSLADKILVQDVITLVESNLKAKMNESVIDKEAAIHVRKLLNIAISTASLL